MIVVIDTNVWISALIFGRPGSVPAHAIKRAVTEDDLVTSTELLGEIHRILRNKYDWSAARIAAQMDRFFNDARIVTLQHNIHLYRDPGDDMFLECAAISQAEVLVTGDKDLLTLSMYGSTRILTPAQYVNLPSGT